MPANALRTDKPGSCAAAKGPLMSKVAHRCEGIAAAAIVERAYSHAADVSSAE
jgi:hypothetical protein